jgi:ABC-2 type transport system permease protein
VRSLLNSEPVGNDIWIALMWCVGIIIVAWFFAMRVYKRRTLYGS